MRRVPVLICLLAVAGACAAPAGASASGRSPAEVQRLEDGGVRDIIVARDPGLTPAARGAMRTTAGVAHVADLPVTDTEVVRAPAGGLVEAIAELEAEPGVRYAEPNGPVHAATTDALWLQQWGLENTGLTVGAPGAVAGTPGADIKAPQAWALSTGAGQTVAVVDSGITFGHDDLAGAAATNAGEVGVDANGLAKQTNGVDDDHDTVPDDVRGYDFVATDNDPTDVFGHGTHVTGTIAARKDNGIGIAGVAPAAKVFPLRALDDLGNGTDATIASAFDVAGRLGIPIVNASIEADVSTLVGDAIAAHPNTLYVLAAGNIGADDDDPATPSLCRLPEANLICVGASDARDAPATFAAPGASTNFGATNVDLFAPGDDIASTYVPFAGCPAAPCYAFLDGTSMAAPHVSGTLALMRARNPSLTATQLKATLIATAERTTALAGKAVSGGRLDAAAAVAASPPAASTAAGVTAGAAAAAAPPPAAATAAAAAAPPSVPSIPTAPVLGRPAIGAGALTAHRPLTIRFTLDRAATVRLTITRGARTVATVSLHGRKGANRYVLRTKVGGRRLARGHYRVRVRAQGAARAYTLALTVR